MHVSPQARVLLCPEGRGGAGGALQSLPSEAGPFFSLALGSFFLLLVFLSGAAFNSNIWEDGGRKGVLN